MKMVFSWMSCIVVLLCYSMQFQAVLAEKEAVGPKTLSAWRDVAASHGGSVNDWEIKNGIELGTDVCGDCSSWFTTGSLNLPITSYLVMEASCTIPPCQFQINGTSTSSSGPYELIQTVTYDNRSSKTITIKKPYSYLRINALNSGSQKKMFQIFSMEMYHYFCDKTTKFNANLNKVDSSTTNISRPGKCLNTATGSDGNSTIITVLCTPKGEWIATDQKCVCKKGFYFDNKQCSFCPIDTYKIAAGNEKCRNCSRGKTNTTMHTECECKEDHYVAEKNDGKCYAVPSAVQELNIKFEDETAVKITWREPKDKDGFNGLLTYTVKYHHCSNKSCNIANATFLVAQTDWQTTNVVVSNLKLNETYKFRVYSMTSLKNVSKDKWNFKDEKYTHTENHTTNLTSTTKSEPTGAPKESKPKDNKFIYIGAGVAFLVIVLLIIALIITRLRRDKWRKSGKENLGFESVTLPIIGQRTYVDPTIYDDPEAALKDFVNEIPAKSLSLERVLGGGEFGDVYKGTMKTEDGRVIDVAAKTLKHDSDERSRKDFFMEASAMGQFDDPNVIHLEGVITKSVPHMIITEYMSNGSLDNFLKQNDGNLTELQLVGMARGVASGMKYLAAMNFVHRDLAARNILVNDALLCKVADFGLSRELENADSSRGEYCTTGGKIPVRWTAPESIKYRKFSTASDVWSYGILLWEIMSFAERPYWDWDNFKVLERVDEGYRLTAPKNCPKAVHQLMLLCWAEDRNQRPEFAEIVKMLDEWIRSPETIRYERISETRPVSGSGINDPAILIKEWLHDIKMSSYIPHFTQAGFKQVSDLAGLLDSDLQVIGVSLIGHRNKMLRTIRTLPITDQSKRTSWNRSPSLKV